MKNLQFSYVMKTVFIEKIVDHSFTLKCVPLSNESQTIQTLNIHLVPYVELSENVDSFGNRTLFGKASDEHDSFIVEVSGEAITTGKPIPELDERKTWIYKYYTKYTTAGEYLTSFFKNNKSLIEEKNNILEQAESFMHAVYSYMLYQPAVTGMSTTAEEAFTIGKGVCQDYAHILLSLLRMMKIPSRYVVGMMEGEGASHAWVEVFFDGAWYGLDPTNDKKVDDTYIHISHGRDSNDCLVERGIFRGNPNQLKLVGVKVTE